MKKIIAALLTLIMATALFAGCGQDNGDVDLPVNVGDTTPKPQVQTPARAKLRVPPLRALRSAARA